MKIVVTGGAGFIGANLCRALAFQFDEVIALDDLSTGRKENLLGVPVSLAEGTILNREFVEGVLESADSVVHLAARPSVPRSLSDPLATHMVNATGTAIVLEAARAVGCRHVIAASSSSVYGNTQVLPKHEGLPVAPLSPYAASKLATESYTLAWGASFGLEVLALRFFNVFGPLQPAGHAYAAVIPAFIAAALAGEPLPVHGDGRQTRDFTFVDSVTAVITKAVGRRLSHRGPVNLAFGSRSSLLDLISELEKILGRPLPIRHDAERAGDVRDSQADQTLLRSLVPDVEPVDLSAGLRRTVEWFEQEGRSGPAGRGKA
jgi:UDP-glucose 4-epimerase